MCLAQQTMQETKLRRYIGSRGAVTGPAGDVYAVERLVQKFPEGSEGREDKWVCRIDSQLGRSVVF